MLEISQNSFDTFLFVRHRVTHPIEAVSSFCEYTIESYVERILEDVICNNDFDTINEFQTDNISQVIRDTVEFVGQDIMTIPDEYEPELVTFFYDHNLELYSLLHMSFLAIYDGLLRYLPNILKNNAVMNQKYWDYRLTTTPTATIVRLMRMPVYV